MLRTIDSDAPFDVVFIDFWVKGDISYQYGYRKTST